MTTMNRRHFLAKSATSTAASLVTPYFVSSSFAKDQSPNDRPIVAAIGTSIYHNRYTGPGDHDGRGAVIGHQAEQFGDMVAVADVNLRHARYFAQKCRAKCEVYQDYRKVLERNDIEAVTVGTTDHWHVKVAIDAMRAGKDVYCEKPLTLTIDEGKKICQVARETGRVLQVGTQQRSEYNSMFLKAVVLARSGRLGRHLKVLSSVGQGTRGGPFKPQTPPSELDWDFWLGQAPKVPYIPERCNYDFRWWLEYSGGQVTDWGVHHTDIAVWGLGKENTGPVEIEGVADYPQIENGFNTAVTFDCTMRYADGQEIRLYSGKNELIFSGERSRIRVNRGSLTGKPVEELTTKDNEWIDEEIVKLCHGKKPGSHMGNFFECIKDRGTTISDVFTHHRSVSVCHLANIAMRLKRKLRWDPEKEDFVGDEQASAMLSRPRRAPYTIDA